MLLFAEKPAAGANLTLTLLLPLFAGDASVFQYLLKLSDPDIFPAFIRYAYFNFPLTM